MGVGRGEPCTADLVELVGRVCVGVDGDLAGAEHGFPWEGRLDRFLKVSFGDCGSADRFADCVARYDGESVDRAS